MTCPKCNSPLRTGTTSSAVTGQGISEPGPDRPFFYCGFCGIVIKPGLFYFMTTNPPTGRCPVCGGILAPPFALESSQPNPRKRKKPNTDWSCQTCGVRIPAEEAIPPAEQPELI